MFITKKNFQKVIAEAVEEEAKRNQLRIEILLKNDRVANEKIANLTNKVILYEQQLFRPRDQRGKFTVKKQQA